MKKYTYSGKSNLVFTHVGSDFLVHGKGPHELPEDASIVKTHVSRGSLQLVEEADKTKVKNA